MLRSTSGESDIDESDSATLVSDPTAMRVEVATHLLRSTNDGLDSVAGKVGYRDAATLRTLLRRKLGRGVRDLRRSTG